MHHYKWQKAIDKISSFTDADWAGDKMTRKSTTGGCVMLGNHLLKAWSNTQTLVALSSGKSELYATLKAASEGLAMISIAKDLGIALDGEVWGDASAALGIMKRRGVGKTRHIDIGLLLIQEVAAEKRLRFGEVLGRDNPADLFTKHRDWHTIHRHCGRVSTTVDDGRAETAPKLHMLKAVCEVDDEDEVRENNEILNSICRPAVKHEPDEFGLLQPVLCLFYARRAGSERARPNDPGNNNNNAPLGGISSARTPAKEPEGKHTVEPGAKRFVNSDQTACQLRVGSRVIPQCQCNAIVGDTPNRFRKKQPRSQLSQGPSRTTHDDQHHQQTITTTNNIATSPTATIITTKTTSNDNE